MLVIPSTKQIASRMFDLPEPFRPVIALNEGSHPVICVRTGYDLNPDKEQRAFRPEPIISVQAHLQGRALRSSFPTDEHNCDGSRVCDAVTSKLGGLQ